LQCTGWLQAAFDQIDLIRLVNLSAEMVNQRRRRSCLGVPRNKKVALDEYTNVDHRGRRPDGIRVGTTPLWDGLLSGKPVAKLVDGLGPTGADSPWLARIGDEGDPRDGHRRFSRAPRSAARETLADASERGWSPGAHLGLIGVKLLDHR
jgi:hypothetical protein